MGAGLEDLADLLDGEAELLVGGEEVRPEADARIGAKVAEDLPLGQLLVDGGELRDVHGHGAAAPAGGRGLRISNPAASARSISSCVCRSEF